MRRITMLALGAAALATMAAPAEAAYRANYASWSKLTPREKAVYVEGLNDASSVVDTGEAANPVQGAMVRGRVKCLNRDKVSAAMLVALIDTQYQNDPSARDLPPMTIYLRETYRICQQDIQASIDAATNPNPKPAGGAPSQ
jgi:hypothetical protein